MRTGKRVIQSGRRRFNDIFNPSRGEYVEIKKNAQLEDTLGLMRKVIATTLIDTQKISKLLKADNEFQTCKNVWEFCFNHLQYEKDEAGKEQVRRPSRTWQDREKGVDCDCMTVFIGSILTNLKIPFLIRLTAYKPQADFEHVYPVALLGTQEIIMDCVVHQFNYQVPYTTKKDVKMKLQYLNGFEDQEDFGSEDAQDYDFFFDQELEGLEGRAERGFRRQERREKRKNGERPILKKVGKGLSKINKLNPVTAIIRGGILASMKTNLFKVGGKLRYSYWSTETAKKNNMDLNKYFKLVKIRERLEKNFRGMGGDTKNLKKAILEGRGNRNRKVALNGFGAIGEVSPYEDLRAVLGDEAFFDEFEDVQFSTGINGLGSVSATAAMASASGIIGTIAGLIKQLGSLFKKGSPQEQEEIINDNTADKELKDEGLAPEDIAKVDTSELPPEIAEKVAEQSANLPSVIEKPESSEVATTSPESEEKTVSVDNSTEPPPKNEEAGLGQWIKDHPVLSAGIAIVAFSGIVWAYKTYQKSKKGAKKPQNLQGVKSTTAKKKKPTKKRVTKPRAKYPVVELL
jgi:hypothetical protein